MPTESPDDEGYTGVLPRQGISAQIQDSLPKRSQTQFELDGSESALLAVASLLLATWPFEIARARSLLTEELRDAGLELHDEVSARWRERLEAVGLWNAVIPWTAELIASRAALKPAISLNASEVPTAIVALDLVAIEFCESAWGWEEFCTVGPGALDWYPIGPADVTKLARRLERAVR